MNKTCRHCLEPVPANVQLHVVIDDESQPVCCLGCKAAAEFIIGAGWTQFYEHRDVHEAASIRPVDKTFDCFDDPDIALGLIHPIDADRAELTVRIENLYCSACIWLLEKALMSVSGVHNVAASAASHRVIIQWNPKEHKVSELLGKIAQLGFKPQPQKPGDISKSRHLEQRRSVRQLAVAAVFGMQTMMLAIALYLGEFSGINTPIENLLRWASLITAIPLMTYSAAPFYTGAWRGLKARSPGMDVPVSLAIVLAFVISSLAVARGSGPVYFDSIAMFVLLLTLSRYLEMRSRHKADDHYEALATMLPATVCRIAADGTREEIALGTAKAGDLLRFRIGDTVAADGQICDGELDLDEAFLSGESQAQPKQLGDKVLAGSLCLRGAATVRVTKHGSQTQLAQVVRLIDKAQASRSPLRDLSDRIASYFVWTVLFIASSVGVFWLTQDPDRALPIVLSILIVSCPCALALATPAALSTAATRLGKMGVLLSNSRLLSALRPGATLVFDKTGTLSCGAPSVVASRKLNDQDLRTTQEYLQIAASLEQASEHVLARAFVQSSTAAMPNVDKAVPVAGQGVSGLVDGEEFRIGRRDFVADLGNDTCDYESSSEHTQIFLGNKTGLLAHFEIRDPLRKNARRTIDQLRDLGFEVGIASGDTHQAVACVAAELGIDTWHAELSPKGKLALIEDMEAQGANTIMIGDGVNDAPVLARANASVAMGAGTDLAQVSADAIIVRSKLQDLLLLSETAGKTRRIIAQNISWAIAYNLSGIAIAAAGYLQPWMAAIGMSLSSLLVLSNSMRLASSQQHRKSQRTADFEMSPAQ